METSREDDATLPPGPAAGRLGLRPPLAAGDLGALGGYRVLRLIGRGGMGAVFLAIDPSLGREVALKVVLPTAGDDAHERFLREARAAASVRGDHVVTIHAVGEDNGSPYLAMELLHGTPLDRWLAAGHRPTLPQLLRIGREIALGLASVHAAGLVHRDIKPANVWLDSANGGRVKLLDFGLARGAGGAFVTRPGALLGTPAYMAPEQARGEEVDARADLFSLGCVLYELAAGERPFDGPDVLSVLAKLATHDPPPPPVLPDDLSRLVMALLDKSPEKRPASAALVADALAAGGGGSALALPRPEDTPTSVIPLPRRPPWTAIGVIAGVLCVAAIILWPRGGPPPEPPPEGGPKKRPEPAAFFHGDPVPGRVVADALLGVEAPEGLLAVIGETRLRHPAPVRALAFTDDGKHLITLAVAEPAVWDVKSGRFVRLLSAAAPLVGLAAGRGEMATSTRDGRALRWDAAGKPLRPLTLGPGVGPLAYAPDGGHLAWGDAAGRVHLVPLDGGKGVTLDGLAGAARAVAFSHDGKQVAAVGAGRRTRVWPRGGGMARTPEYGDARALAFGPALAVLSDKALFVEGSGRIDVEGGAAVAWHPTRPVLAYTSDARTVRVAGADEPGRALFEVRHPWPVSCLAFSPDGAILAAGCEDGVVRLIDATGADVIPPDGVAAAAFTPGGDGVTLARPDGTLQTLRLADGKILASGKAPARTGVLTYDSRGTRLAAGTHDRARPWRDVPPELVLLDAGTLAQVRDLKGVEATFPSSMPGVVVVNDGKRLGVWSLEKGTLESEVVPDEPGGFMRRARVSDGMTFAYSWTPARQPRFWTMQGKPSWTAPAPAPGPKVMAVAARADDRYLAASYEGWPVQWIDTAEMKVVARLRVLGPAPEALAVSSAGLVAGASSDGTLPVWEPRPGPELAPLRSPRVWPRGCSGATLAWSADGKTLLVLTRGGVLLVLRP